MAASKQKVAESSPLLFSASDYIAPKRASYAGVMSATPPATGESADPFKARSQSMPVLTRRNLQRMKVSDFFYRKFYTAKGGTMLTSAFNLASATLGAGALALPYAMYHSGVLCGTLILLLIWLCTVYSVFLLVRIGELTDLHSYEELAGDLISPRAEKVTSLLIVTFCWGVGLMYVVVMGDFVSPLIARAGLSAYIGRRTAMCFFWSIIMFPLSLVRRITELSYASIVGSASTLLLAGALILKATDGTGASHSWSDVPLFRYDSNTIGALSTFLFSYCCQPVVFSVYGEMNGATVKKMTWCATMSLSVCTLIYITTGVSGAYAYGPSIRPNVLSNFADHLSSIPVQLAFFGMSVAVTMAFPMTIFPTRDSVVFAMGYREEENPAPPAVSSGVAGVLALLALLVGMFVPSIHLLFDLLGGVCGGSLSFLLPGWFALRSGYWQVADVGWFHVAAAWLLVFLGAGMCVLGTFNAIVTNML